MKITPHCRKRYMQRIAGITDKKKTSNYLRKLHSIVNNNIQIIYNNSVCIAKELDRNPELGINRIMLNEKANIIIIHNKHNQKSLTAV